MSKYHCHYTLKDALGGQDSHMVVSSERGISEFSEGFWITEKYKLSTGMDAAMWIPPHCIKFVRVERTSE